MGHEQVSISSVLFSAQRRFRLVLQPTPASSRVTSAFHFSSQGPHLLPSTTMLNRASSSPETSERILLRRLVLIGGGLSTLAILAYSSILNNTFLAEDFWQSRILSISGWTQMAFFPRNGGYRPVMIVWWAVGNFVWGDQPFPYRIRIGVQSILETSGSGTPGST